MNTNQQWSGSVNDTLRDIGLDRVAVANIIWLNDFHNFVVLYFKTAPETFAWEDVRLFAEDFGLRQPSHKNVWGASIATYLPLLEIVGSRNSRRPEAHSRMTRIYSLKDKTYGI